MLNNSGMFEPSSRSNIKHIERKFRPKHIVNVRITSKCNFKCPYCSWFESKGTDITEEAFQNIVTTFPQSSFLIYGGEPTLHKHFDAIMQNAPNDAVLMTNGSSAKVLKHIRKVKLWITWHVGMCDFKRIKTVVDLADKAGSLDDLAVICPKEVITKDFIKRVKGMPYPITLECLFQDAPYVATHMPWFFEEQSKDVIVDGALMSDSEIFGKFATNFEGAACTSGIGAVSIDQHGVMYRCDHASYLQVSPIHDFNKGLWGGQWAEESCKFKRCYEFYNKIDNIRS